MSDIAIPNDVTALQVEIAQLQARLAGAHQQLAAIGGPPQVLGLAQEVIDDIVNTVHAQYGEMVSVLVRALLEAPTYQSRVNEWVEKCFGPVIAADARERNHRFLEESLELVQACGCTISEAHQLVDYVFNRPVGEKHQEVGGVMVTLAGLCQTVRLDMRQCGEVELARVWNAVEKIRAKQAAKPKHSPLPGFSNV